MAFAAAAQRTLFRWMHENRVTILQASLGLVFIWFGLLKIVGRSPVEEIVAGTFPWIPAAVFVPFLGIWEVVIGGLLLWGRFVRTMLALFLVQMAGTFLVFIMQPGLAFQGNNPLALSTEGEFVIKNVVLIAAGLSIAGHLLGPRVIDAGDENS